MKKHEFDVELVCGHGGNPVVLMTLSAARWRRENIETLPMYAPCKWCKRDKQIAFIKPNDAEKLIALKASTGINE